MDDRFNFQLTCEWPISDKDNADPIISEVKGKLQDTQKRYINAGNMETKNNETIDK